MLSCGANGNSEILSNLPNFRLLAWASDLFSPSSLNSKRELHNFCGLGLDSFVHQCSMWPCSACLWYPGRICELDLLSEIVPSLTSTACLTIGSRSCLHDHLTKQDVASMVSDHSILEEYVICSKDLFSPVQGICDVIPVPWLHSPQRCRAATLHAYCALLESAKWQCHAVHSHCC